MRLAYIQPYNLTFLQPWFILETILLVLNVFIYVVWLIIMVKAHLHINLKILCIAALVEYFPCMAARFIILAFQSRLLSPPLDSSSSSFLIFLTFLRMNMLIRCMCFPLWLFFERRLAMHYIQDYEKHPRLWISVSILLLATVYVWINLVCFTFEWIHWTWLAVVTLLMGFVGTIMFCQLERKTKKMQKELGKVGKKSIVDYSLSLRFQLEENLWSCKLIRNSIYLFVIINSLGSLAFALANLELTQQILSSETCQLLDCLFNICIAINGPILALGTVFYNDYLIKLIKTIFFGIEKLQEPDAGEVYFEELQKQWNFKELGQERAAGTRKTAIVPL